MPEIYSYIAAIVVFAQFNVQTVLSEHNTSTFFKNIDRLSLLHVHYNISTRVLAWVIIGSFTNLQFC